MQAGISYKLQIKLAHHTWAASPQQSHTGFKSLQYYIYSFYYLSQRQGNLDESVLHNRNDWEAVI
jgi:hypothetical protein